MRPLRILLMVTWLAIWAISASAQDAAAEKTPKSSGLNVAETENGGIIRWGFDLALVRVRASRRADEPARLRHYEMDVDAVPGAFGFSVYWDSPEKPWRITLKSGRALQLLSVGALLLFEKGKIARQSSVSIGIGLGLLDRFIIIGIMADLYRGVPVESLDGRNGASTAETGILAWSWGKQGETTPENVSFVVSLGLSQLFSKIGTGD
jgi:hypothetical protein